MHDNTIVMMGPDDEPHQLPFVWAICDRCDGHGKHDHPAFSNGITQDEWNEWDYDEREDYLSGAYDVPCTVCGGSGKVKVVDEARCSPEELEAYQRAQEVFAEGRAAERSERFMSDYYERDY